MTYRCDNTRSGVSTERIETPLALRWTFIPTHAPTPAWPKPGEEMERMHFDNAHHVTSSRGLVYFGSSVDNTIYALSARSGQIKWTFTTEGPVRYAPTIWKNRIYAGSDDGHVYCLKAKSGKLIWKYRPGPSEEKLLGNGRMISLWPVRTSVLVDDGIVYFGAGVFPYEGIHICALDAEKGSVIWKNDTTGDRAHELAYGGISPQSYLVASENILYVPSGRAMPAAFGRKTGQFLHYLLPGAKVGGTWALLDEGNLIAGVDHSGTPAKRVYDEQSGSRKSSLDDMHAWFPGTDLVVTPDISYTLTEDGIFALDRERFIALRGSELNDLVRERQEWRDRLSDVRTKIRAVKEEEEDEEEEVKNPVIEVIEKKLMDLAEEEERLKASMCRWEYPHSDLTSLILVGNRVFAGGEGIAVGLEAESGKELWKTEVQGNIQGLASSGGNLFVSTDNGNIYCFREGERSREKITGPSVDSSPYRKDKLSRFYESTAERIIRETGIQKGYGLVLGSGSGRLAYELGKRTELKIIGIEKDRKKIVKAKRALNAAGLYGSRIVVENWDLTELPDYFADLIVSEEMMLTGDMKYSAEEMFRVLKPYGGVAYFGQPLDVVDKTDPLDEKRLLEWLSRSGAKNPEISRENGIWAKFTRGKLEGSGYWTEQYGNPQNTACSMDQLVKGPLGVLWFGEPGPEKMVERHAKSASPVSMKGRIFVQGEEVIMAYDVFNGTLLWERHIPGAVRPRADVDGGNLVVTEDCLYVAAHDACHCLSPQTGETLREIKLPMSSGWKSYRWGYVSIADNTLYGSRAEPLKNEYFALRELLVEDGKWKDVEKIPSEYREEYQNLIERYPVPDEKLWADFKRSGTLWRFMADFPDWEMYESSEGALTENVMLSDRIFALDPATGTLRWTHRGSQIAHITISLGDGKIFFAENKVSSARKRQALAHRQQLIRKGVYEEARVLKDEEEIPHEVVQQLIKEGLYERFEVEQVSFEDADVRTMFCLDSATGKKLWERTLDFTGCGGDMMGTAYKDGMLLVFSNMGDHDAWRFQNGSLRWKRLTVLSAKTGEVLWSRALNYRTRPVIVGDQVFIEPRVCDLRTGKIKMREHPVTGEQVPWEYLRPGHTCAITSASAHALFYRSYSTAIYDFSKDDGLVIFGGIRPGCWINMIPANGLLLFPEASAGCTCSFPLRCSLVLKHKENRVKPWTVFITHGPMSPAKHFAINLGAPADMKDDDGTVWFGYPNPATDYTGNHFPNYGLKFDLQDDILKGMGYFCTDFKEKTIEGTGKPWLFTSGCVGLTRCEVPLIDDIWGDKPGVYTVRLGFSALVNDRVGQRVFDVSLQGKPVLTEFDIIQEAGNANKSVIKEFRNIRVDNTLLIEFSSKEDDPSLQEAPLINFIEVQSEDVEPSKTARPVRPISMSRAESLLQQADQELSWKRYERALERYHAVFDASSAISMKQWALEGMAAVGSPKSLSRIVPFCRDTDPILWDYKEPNPVLRNSAVKVFITVANTTAKTDKQKAVKMLNYALSIANFENQKLALAGLRRLGIEIYGESGRQD